MSAFAFVLAEKANHPVAILCRTLGVSRSGFYAWVSRPPSARRRRDVELTASVATAFADSRRTYGAPRIHAVLRRDGVRVARKRVARLMREAGIEGVSRRRGRLSLTRPDPAAPPAPDRVARRFRAEGPDRLWLSDITYLPTHEGWLYLAVVSDMWSRRIVGWSMREDCRPIWSWTPCTWPATAAAPAPAASCTPTAARSTPACCSARRFATQDCFPAWAVAARPWTTRRLSR